MDIEEDLVKIAEQEGISNVTVENLPQAKQGQGYLSNINIVTLLGETKTKNKQKLSLIVKIAGTNEKLRQASAVSEIFQSEIRMYESIFPAFYEFEKGRGIMNPFASVPRCFKIFKDRIPEILIFENLNESGYRNWNSKLLMDSEHVKVVLKEYAHFHSISFAMRDQTPELFYKLTENFQNTLMIFFERSDFTSSYINKAKELLTLFDPKTDAKLYDRYKEFLNGITDKFKLLLDTCDDSYAILHGDGWCNNMLFKYQEPNHPERPTGVRFIDFQLTRLASPIIDVVHFLYVCASKDVLENIDVYKRVYYDSFSEHLRVLGSNPDDLISFEMFEKHWKSYAIFGLIISSLEHHSLLTEENEVINLTQVIEEGGSISKAFDYDIANKNEYQSRMRAIVQHFVENNLI